MKVSTSQIKSDLDIIETALTKFENGAGIEELREATGLEIELRTFQRRLDRLQKEGVIYMTGSTRGTLYHLRTDVEKPVLEELSFAIPLTKNSLAIIGQVSRPIQSRIPVGYNRLFLENYRPDKDSYLTVAERSRLAEIGKTTAADQAAGTYAKEVMSRLLIDLSWNSSRLEGNTYSLLDTERLLSLGETADNHSAAEAQMILNHKDAIQFLVSDAAHIGFNRYTILNLHALLSNNLLTNPAASGRLRTIEVRIGQSVFTPLVIPQLIEEMFELILVKANAIQDPFEQAFFMMVHLPYLQPFDDVNKRVSRLAANISLNRHNLSPLSFIDVPDDIYIQAVKGVYELNKTDLLKDVFLWAYERSAARYAAIRQSLGEPDPFRLKYRDQIRELVAQIVNELLDPKNASVIIKKKKNDLPQQDRAKFEEVVEIELMNLHEGNFARFWIRPSVFKEWKAGWL